MADFNTRIPVGFRFDPTDDQLIADFLWRKVMGLELPWNGVLDKKLYGEDADPWEVLGDVDPLSMYWHNRREGGATKSLIYVFTTLVRVANSSRRISRHAGCGTWSGQTGPKTITDSAGKPIGVSKMLSFQCSASNATPAHHWIMHEYSLTDDLVRSSGRADAADFVLCKITRCNRKDSKKRAAEEECSGQKVGDAFKKQKKSSCGGGGGEGCPDAVAAAAKGFGGGDKSPPLDFDDNIDIEYLFGADSGGLDVEFLMQL